MKLISLEINNFRQFYGKQIIKFAAEPGKSVTLIHGENNGGKTALLNALRWCLYEETTSNLQDPHNLINKHALASGKDSFGAYVQLVHDNRLLEVRRTGFHSKRNSTLKIFEIVDGCYSESPEKHVNELINTFLPQEMSRYFFYQGEGTGTLNSQNDFSHIKDAISKVLGLTIAEKTVTHLSRVKNDYQRELTQYDTDNEIEELLSNKDILQVKHSSNIELLNKKKLLLKDAEIQYEEQIVKLDRLDRSSIDELIKLRTQKESTLKLLRRELANLYKQKMKGVSIWIFHAFSRNLSEVSLAEINTDALKSSSRYTVDERLIKEIQKNRECICGSSFEEDSEAGMLIANLSKSAINLDLKRRWNRVIELHSKISRYSSPKQDMLEVLSSIDDCEDNISELTRDIAEFSRTIEKSNVEGIKEVEKLRVSAKNRCDALQNEIPHLEREVSRAKIDLEDIELKVDRLSSSLPKAKKIRNLIAATSQIAQLFEDAIKSSKDGVDLILLKKMQVLFSRVSLHGYTVRKSSSGGTNDRFIWVIVDDKGKRVAAGNGYQAMLAISFIVSLIEFSKERANSKQHLLTPGTIAPFIADSILAFIDSDNGRELVRYISESVEQSIFMFSQAQWTEAHTDKGIRDRIGKEYNLVQHTVFTEEDFKGAYPTKLAVQGKEFDVVRFGSDFDKVTIEEIEIDD